MAQSRCHTKACQAMACLLTVWLLLAPAHASKLSGPLSVRIHQSGPHEGIPVIIRLTSPDGQPDIAPLRTTPRALKKRLVDRTRTGQTALADLLDGPDVGEVKTLWIINGLSLRASTGAIAALSAHARVARIDLNLSLPMMDPVEPLAILPQAAEPAWNLTGINVPDLWAMGITGTGVVVASMDTGVDGNHADLAPRYRGGSNSWFDPYGQHAAPYDGDGHGTQTMGLILAGDQTGTPLGAAPGARWIAVKIFNDQGEAVLDKIHLGYQWILDPDNDPATDDAPAVVNNSWGFIEQVNLCDAEFAPDLAALEAAGIVSVFAAGNAGPSANTSISPANNGADTLPTGSVSAAWTVSSFSSRGPGACDGGLFPLVVAPGQSVTTTDLSFGGLFASRATVSGTSFAAPHVAGVLVLLKEAFPGVTPAQLREAIATTALDLAPAGPDNATGMGLVDALSAHHHLAGDCTLTVRAAVSPMPPRLGQSALFSAIANGGTAPLAFEWDVDGDGTTDCTTAECEHTFTDYTHATATVRVVDATFCQAQRAMVLSVGIRLSGSVVDGNLTPVSQATVAIAQHPEQTTEANPDGSFLLYAPPNARLHLTATPLAGNRLEYATTHTPYLTTKTADLTAQALLLHQNELTAAASATGADIASGAVMGVVTDTSGAPLSGAVVTLTDDTGQGLAAQAIYRDDQGQWNPVLTATGTSGAFAVFNVPTPPREITIRAEKSGWAFVPVAARVYPLGADQNTVTAALSAGVAEVPAPTPEPLPESVPQTPPDVTIQTTTGSSGSGGCFIKASRGSD